MRKVISIYSYSFTYFTECTSSSHLAVSKGTVDIPDRLKERLENLLRLTNNLERFPRKTTKFQGHGDVYHQYSTRRK